MATMQSTMNDICPSSNIACMQPSSLNKNPTTHANSHVSSDTSALTHSNSTSDVSPGAAPRAAQGVQINPLTWSPKKKIIYKFFLILL